MSEVCNFLLAEYDYDADVAVQRDEAYKVGVEKGMEMRNIKLARSFRDMGFPIDKIAKTTGLTEEEINELR